MTWFVRYEVLFIPTLKTYPDGVDISKFNYHKFILNAWLDMLKLDYLVDTSSKFHKGALVGNDMLEH